MPETLAEEGCVSHRTRARAHPHTHTHTRTRAAGGAAGTLTTTLGWELGTAWGTMRPACGFRVARAGREDNVRNGLL